MCELPSEPIGVLERDTINAKAIPRRHEPEARRAGRLMSVVIQQDKTQTGLSLALHTRAELMHLRLVESQISSPEQIDSFKLPLRFEVSFKAGNASVAGDILAIGTAFTFDARDSSSGDFLDSSRVVSIECKFQAQYKLVAGYTPSREEINAFQTGNGVLTCWPYFREYVQNSVERLSLPSFSLPFMRLLITSPVEPMRSRQGGETPRQAALGSPAVRSKKAKRAAKKRI